MFLSRKKVFVFGVAAVLAQWIPGASTGYAADCGDSYKVRSGDHVGKIAKRCGVSIATIEKLNAGLDPSRLRIGQRLVMPGALPGRLSEIDESDKITVTGVIVNGRRCALLETADGKVYGLVSPRIPFVSGKHIKVRGSMHAYDGCRPDLTVLVTEIHDAGS